MPPLSVDTRRAAIVDAINHAGHARVEELAERFTVSAMTIHRDLAALNSAGLISRIRGGATPVIAMIERNVTLRRATNAAIKQSLAEVAVTFIQDTDVIALDDSTTVAAMLTANCHPAAIITHSLALMHEVATQPTPIPLVGLGGRYVAGTDSFLGQATIDHTAGLSADLSFVSTTCLRHGAIYHPDEDAARTKTAITRLGERRVLITDTSKLGISGLHHVADLSEFQDIVIDANLDADTHAMLADSGARLHLVDTPRPEPTVNTTLPLI